jgi:hypothetical protein
MALFNCPECERQVSDLALTCPNCGYPVNKLNTNHTIDKALIECGNTAKDLWRRTTNLNGYGENHESDFVYIDIINSFPDSKQAKWAKKELERNKVPISQMQKQCSAQNYWTRAQDFHVNANKPQIAYYIYSDIVRKYPSSEEAKLSGEQISILQNKYGIENDTVTSNVSGDYSIESMGIYSMFAGGIGLPVGFALALFFNVSAAANHYESSSRPSSISYSIGLFAIMAPLWVAQSKVAARNKAFKYKLICGLMYIISLVISFFVFAFYVFK